MKTFSPKKVHFWTIWLDIFELTGGKEEILQLVPTHEWSTLVGRVQICILPSETDRENEIVLGRVSEEETSLWLVRQQFLGLVSVDLSPVERAVDDLTLQKREKLSIRIPGLVTNLFLFC